MTRILLQMFSLPHDVLQQTKDTSMDSADDAATNTGTVQQPESQDMDATDLEVPGKRAIDTGHWGKRLHEPSPFLSHDLWAKLGEDRKVL